jgi:hypothetical protein
VEGLLHLRYRLRSYYSPILFVAELSGDHHHRHHPQVGLGRKPHPMDGGVGVPILAQVSEWLREVGIPAQVLEDVSIATITSLNRYRWNSRLLNCLR